MIDKPGWWKLIVVKKWTVFQMVEFSAIPVFVAVVECGSFSKAGEKLGTSKSAVSKRITQLEQRLGVRLFQRSTRSLSLTEAGEHYYDYAGKAYALACEGEDRVTELQGTPKGLLRLSVPMSFGRLHLAPLVPEFLASYPDVQLELSMDDRMVDLVEGGFDLAIRIGHLPDSQWIARRLAPCLSVVCASPEYLARAGTPRTPADLARHNCLFYSYFRGGSEWRFDSPSGPVRVQPQGNYRVNNSEAIRDALVAGMGICQLPTFIVGEDLEAGRLVPILEAYPLPRHSVFAVFAERRHRPAKVTALLDFLEERLGGDKPYWDVHLN